MCQCTHSWWPVSSGVSRHSRQSSCARALRTLKHCQRSQRALSPPRAADSAIYVSPCERKASRLGAVLLQSSASRCGSLHVVSSTLLLFRCASAERRSRWTRWVGFECQLLTEQGREPRPVASTEALGTVSLGSLSADLSVSVSAPPARQQCSGSCVGTIV